MIRIQTGRRLHFGLFSPLPIPELDLVYGGLGVIVDTPGVIISGIRSNEWLTTGLQQSRAKSVVERLASVTEITPLHVNVESMAPVHQGWGTGTQLTMAISRLCYLGNNLEWSAASTAKQLGRGQRSGIGIVGFEKGGLLLDHGRTPDSEHPGQVQSFRLPGDWTFVLVEPGHEQGLHSEEERLAFTRLSKIEVRSVLQLRAMAKEELIPFAQAGDFNQFANQLTQYNRLAGTFYSEVQHGCYSTRLTEERLEIMRQHGAAGRGQSSWGPGLFALFPTRIEAESFCTRCSLAGCRMIIAPVMNHGVLPSTKITVR